VIEGRRQAVDHRAQGAPEEEIADRLAKIEPAAGLRDARDLGEKLGAVVDVMDAAEHDHRIEGVARQRQTRRVVG
jgi:hypothetical protein